MIDAELQIAAHPDKQLKEGRDWFLEKFVMNHLWTVFAVDPLPGQPDAILLLEHGFENRLALEVLAAVINLEY